MKAWQGTEKRVPLVLAQTLTALQSVQFQIIPQFPFRGEQLVVDPQIAASCTVQPPSVGPNVQVAGGSNTAAVSGQMFPPNQTDCLKFGMDVANEGNQLSLVVASLLTSTSLNFAAYLMGTVAEEMSPAQAAAAGAAQRAGISPARSYMGRAGISPAGTFHR